MKAPSSSGATNQLLQQYMLSNMQSQQQQAAFQQQLADQQAADQVQVAAAAKQQQSQVASATRKPLNFSTILTSPAGLLGNPLLAQTKLS